ncbi:MAG: sigma-70 family RNA polymerase sigma factor [Vicinamibacterales bacterium]
MSEPAAGPQQDPEESALLERLRAGDDEAYETLVRQHGPRLMAVARRFLASEDDARDVVQDAFLSAFRSLGRFEGQARLSTWLHRIVVNAALMKLRTRRRKPEEPLDPLLPAYRDDGHHAERFSSWDEPADVALERRETRDLVRRLIDELPETYRTVLLLRDIEGFGTDETAELLGVTPNAAKIRLHRARQALRTLLAPHFKGDRA